MSTYFSLYANCKFRPIRVAILRLLIIQCIIFLQLIIGIILMKTKNIILFENLFFLFNANKSIYQNLKRFCLSTFAEYLYISDLKCVMFNIAFPAKAIK